MATSHEQLAIGCSSCWTKVLTHGEEAAASAEFSTLITQGNFPLKATLEADRSCPTTVDPADFVPVLVHYTHFVLREGPEGFAEVAEHFAGGAHRFRFCCRFIGQLDPDLVDLAVAIVVMEEISWQ
jgi:hypothetical protein